MKTAREIAEELRDEIIDLRYCVGQIESALIAYGDAKLEEAAQAVMLEEANVHSLYSLVERIRALKEGKITSLDDEEKS